MTPHAATPNPNRFHPETLVSRSVYQRTFPSSTRHLEEVRRFVEAVGLEAHLSAEAVEQFKLAVDEACTNVIKHAYKGDDAQQIDISVIVEPDRFTVRIRDEGESFQEAAYRTPDLKESARLRRPGGFGIHIMRRLMDQVEYNTSDDFNEVSLTKFLTGANIANGDGKH